MDMFLGIRYTISAQRQSMTVCQEITCCMNSRSCAHVIASCHPVFPVLKLVDAMHSPHLTPRRSTLQVVLGCIGTLVAAVVLIIAAAVLLGVQISGLGFHRSSAGSAASGGDICSWSAYRLPPNVVPTAYNLTFDVALDQPSKVRVCCSLRLL